MTTTWQADGSVPGPDDQEEIDNLEMDEFDEDDEDWEDEDEDWEDEDEEVEWGEEDEIEEIDGQ